MGKKKDQNQPESRQARLEEIRRLTDEIIRLDDLYEQGQIDKEQYQKRGPLVRKRIELTDLVRKEKTAKHRDWFLADEIGAQRLAEIEDDIPRLPKVERKLLRLNLKREIEEKAPPSQRDYRAELYYELETWSEPTGEWERVTREFKKEDKHEYIRVEQDDSNDERYDELADAIVELMGVDPKKIDQFDRLAAWADEHKDLCPEWIYWRILRYLYDAPIIEKGYESTRNLLKETASYFRDWARNIDRRKGKRKTKAGGPSKPYPRLECDPVEIKQIIIYEREGYFEKLSSGEVHEVEIGKEVESGFKAPGIVITPDEQGRPIQRVPGYGPGVPLERDKLEDELLIELFGFLLKKEFPPKDAYYLLQDIFLAFLGKSLSWRTIQTRILPHATD